MAQFNFLNYQGYITDEDRKRPIEHRGDHLTFKSCVDLSQGIEVTLSCGDEISAEAYAKDVAIFTGWWSLEVWHSLNGFSGFGGIKFNVKGFKVVNRG